MEKNPLDRYFEEIERIAEEERKLSLPQKLAVIGLAGILLADAYLIIVALFQL